MKGVQPFLCAELKILDELEAVDYFEGFHRVHFLIKGDDDLILKFFFLESIDLFGQVALEEWVKALIHQDWAPDGQVDFTK